MGKIILDNRESVDKIFIMTLTTTQRQRIMDRLRDRTDEQVIEEADGNLLSRLQRTWIERNAADFLAAFEFEPFADAAKEQQAKCDKWIAGELREQLELIGDIPSEWLPDED